jgi:hypothetical protein
VEVKKKKNSGHRAQWDQQKRASIDEVERRFAMANRGLYLSTEICRWIKTEQQCLGPDRDGRKLGPELCPFWHVRCSTYGEKQREYERAKAEKRGREKEEKGTDYTRNGYSSRAWIAVLGNDKQWETDKHRQWRSEEHQQWHNSDGWQNKNW